MNNSMPIFKNGIHHQDFLHRELHSQTVSLVSFIKDLGKKYQSYTTHSENKRVNNSSSFHEARVA